MKPKPEQDRIAGQRKTIRDARFEAAIWALLMVPFAAIGAVLIHAKFLPAAVAAFRAGEGFDEVAHLAFWLLACLWFIGNVIGSVYLFFTGRVLHWLISPRGAKGWRRGGFFDCRHCGYSCGTLSPHRPCPECGAKR